MKPYRVAIIGTGGIAKAHVNALRQLEPRVEIVAAADVSPTAVEAFGAQHGIPRLFTSAADMLSAVQPDLVHIATPPAIHRDLIIQSLEAGASVLCEKPLCASLAQLDDIEAAEARTGRYCSTIFQWRFGSAAQHVKRLIASNELGKLLVGVCNTLWYRSQAYYDVPWRGKWSTEIGGVTVGHGIHLMDLFLWLAGDWHELEAMAATVDRSIEVDTVSMALVQFESGTLATIANSVVSPRQETHLRLDFQRATVEVKAHYTADNTHWTCSLIEEAPDPRALESWQAIKGDQPGGHGAQIAALLDSMDRGERPLVSGPESRRIIEFIASLYKSAATGKRVARGSIQPGDPFYVSMHGSEVLQTP